MSPVSVRPPRLAAWLARLCLHEVDAAAVLGDLEETYRALHRRYGRAAARRWYWSQVLRSTLPLASRTFYWSFLMLKNYLKIALRTLRKQAGFAFINVFGLAVGIALCALIFLYVRHELTYDQFHERAERVYRVTNVRYHPDGSIRSNHPYLPMPLAPALEGEFPDVEHAVRLFEQDAFVRFGPTMAKEAILFVDPAFLEVFSFPLLQGNPTTALAHLNSIIVSKRTARTYFGDDNPLGKTLSIRLDQSFEDFIVTGIAEDTPSNSSIHFAFLASFAKLPETFDWIKARTERWSASSFFTYVQLAEHASAGAMAPKLSDFAARHHPEFIASMRERGWTGTGLSFGYHLQPLGGIHLDPSVQGGLTPPSDPAYSYLLLAIALGILFIACINFTTLTIGRSASRAREVGIRKVVGAQRGQLMAQFWGEAVWMSLLALGIGILLAEVFLPVFNTLADKQLHFDYLDNGVTLVALFGLMLLAGLAGGSYPALVLSGFKPIEAFRKHLKLGGANALTRSLVVVQFALSIFLLTGTLVMLQQLRYLQKKNLGFDKEQVVVIPTQGLDGVRVLSRFQAEIGQRNDILGLTGVSNTFTGGYSLEGFDYQGEDKRAFTFRIEQTYLAVLGIDLVAGRNFDPNLSTDSTSAVLVNEALVRDFGWTEPIGQVLHGFYAAPTVVGVVQDYHFRSLHEAIAPMVLMMDPSWGLHYVLARTASDDLPATMKGLQAAWERIAPDVPFQYSFLDDDLNQQYQQEQRWSRIIGYAAVFAILIACLGLFGLAALAAAGRTKEVGIRKVLGASIAHVAFLLSKDLARLVVIAILLAVPVAYFVMRHWLEGFAYRIDISWEIFLLAGLMALLVAALSVSYQALRAALTNPVDSLRCE